MSNPCDFSVCDPSRCHDEVCMSGIESVGWDEPSAGSIPESIHLPQELEAYIRGANAYAKEKAKQ